MTLTGDRAQPTLEEVAALAGVSRATVSRVVNGSPRVSAEARSLVQRAVAQLGYVPNRAARSLVTRRTDSIALVMSEPEDRVFSDPFFARIVRGVSAELAATEVQLVLVMARSPAQEERLERYVAGGHAVAVQHLLARGRRRIATITGPLDMAPGLDRLDGYRDALRAAGARATRRLVEEGDFTEESGQRAMRALLERAADMDAVFAANDLMAAGALDALRAAGRRVPEDVAVVGFDDSVVSRWSEPRLTSVAQPVEEMGRQITRLLLARIAGEAAGVSVILHTNLVVRESS